LRDLQAALCKETFGFHHLAGLQTTDLLCRFAQCQCRNYTLNLALHSRFLLHRGMAQLERHSLQSCRGVTQAFQLDYFPFNHTTVAAQYFITLPLPELLLPEPVLQQHRC